MVFFKVKTTEEVSGLVSRISAGGEEARFGWTKPFSRVLSQILSPQKTSPGFANL